MKKKSCNFLRFCYNAPMQNKKINSWDRKDSVLYVKASANNLGKRILLERGSVAFLEGMAALAGLRQSQAGIVSSWFWENVLKEELTKPLRG